MTVTNEYNCWWWDDIENDVVLFWRISHLMILHVMSIACLSDDKNFDASDDTSRLNSSIATVNSLITMHILMNQMLLHTLTSMRMYLMMSHYKQCLQWTDCLMKTLISSMNLYFLRMNKVIQWLNWMKNCCSQFLHYLSRLLLFNIVSSSILLLHENDLYLDDNKCKWNFYTASNNIINE